MQTQYVQESGPFRVSDKNRTCRKDEWKRTSLSASLISTIGNMSQFVQHYCTCV